MTRKTLFYFIVPSISQENMFSRLFNYRWFLYEKFHLNLRKYISFANNICIEINAEHREQFFFLNFLHTHISRR